MFLLLFLLTFQWKILMFKSVCQWGMGALGCLLYAIVPSCLQAQETSFLPPVMGWSSWNTYRIHISEDLIKKQTDAMVAQGPKACKKSAIRISTLTMVSSTGVTGKAI